jgi:ABC-type multidrug transport system ATPase subunit
VILTIHQPRLEIFHMFHRLVLLSDGKVRQKYTVHDVEDLRREGGREGGRGGREREGNG